MKSRIIRMTMTLAVAATVASGALGATLASARGPEPQQPPAFDRGYLNPFAKSTGVPNGEDQGEHVLSVLVVG